MRYIISIMLMVILLQAGCRDKRHQHESVLLITVDSLRIDQLDSPAFKKLRKSGVTFTNVITPTPVSIPATVSIMTGFHPWGHGFLSDSDYELGGEAITFGEVFQTFNWRTVAKVGASNMGPETGLAQGFDSYGHEFDSVRLGLMSKIGVRPAGELVAGATIWLSLFGDKSFFMWVHFADMGVPMADRAAILSYVDRAVSELIEALPGKGKQTIIILTSPAAAAGSAHDEGGHGMLLFDSTLKVPLVIAGPGIDSRESDVAATLVDILPTVVSFLNLTLPTGLQGNDLSPILRGGSMPAIGDERVIVTYEPFFRWGWSPLAALRTDKFKYIRTPKPELYDLEADPDENNNIAPDQADKVKEMETRLSQIEARLKINQPPGKHLYDVKIPDNLVDMKDRKHVLPLVMEGAEKLNAKEYAQAVEILEKARRIDPDNRNIPYFLAQSYGGLKDTPKAIEFLEIAVKNNPGNPFIMATLGEAYMDAGDLKKALPQFETALAIEPAMRPVYHQMAFIYRSLGDAAEGSAKVDGLKRALSYLFTAMRLGDRDAETYYNIGSISMEIAQIMEIDESDENAAKPEDYLSSAVKALGLALKQDPEMADAHFALGQILAISANRKDEGKEHLTKFLELAPDSSDAAYAKELLGQMPPE